VAKVVIYYRKSVNEKNEQTVKRINKFIQSISSQHKIKGVLIDNYSESNAFLELVESQLNDIDVIYINQMINNEFEKELLNQLSNTDKFSIKLFMVN
jgi:hypothetical protein